MIPPIEKEGYWKQLKNFFKGQDPFRSQVEDEIRQSILEVLPDPQLALCEDLLMTGQAVVENFRQVVLCVKLQHTEDLCNSVSRPRKLFSRRSTPGLALNPWNLTSQEGLGVLALSHVIANRPLARHQSHEAYGNWRRGVILPIVRSFWIVYQMWYNDNE